MAFGFRVEPSPVHRWVASGDAQMRPIFGSRYILTTRLKEVHDPDLRLQVGVDVPLGRPEVLCPARTCTSRSDPPTVDIFRAALVMKVRRPLWLEQPTKPRCRYHLRNMLTIAWGEVDSARSALMTKGPVKESTSFRYSMRASLTSSFRGIIRPDRPLLAES
jgi:hypothetical protein